MQGAVLGRCGLGFEGVRVSWLKILRFRVLWLRVRVQEF